MPDTTRQQEIVFKKQGYPACDFKKICEDE